MKNNKMPGSPFAGGEIAPEIRQKKPHQRRVCTRPAHLSPAEERWGELPKVAPLTAGFAVLLRRLLELRG